MRSVSAAATLLFALSINAGTLRAEPSFSVRRVADDTAVFTGSLSAAIQYPDAHGTAALADFTALRDPGHYYLDVPDVGRSVAFRIGDDVYDAQLVSAMLGFYGWRSGIDVAFDHHGTHYAHSAGHTTDALLDMVGQAGVIQDATGGWYDAGDYGKYIITAAESVGTLLFAWELFHEKLEQVSLPFIPEHGGPLPDFLAELKWELDWMLKLAYADQSGRIYHKVNSPNFPGFVLPAHDTLPRYLASYSTTATADFVATTAKAARVFAPYDAAYAERLLAAAQASYAFLQANANNVSSDLSRLPAGNYQSTDADDRLWAAAELWETTGDPSALADFEARATPPTLLADFDWQDLQDFGFFTYLLSARAGRDPAVLSQVSEQLAYLVSIAPAWAAQSAYGRALSTYYWGSNGSVARLCTLLMTAHALVPDPVHLDVCADQVGYLYGRNQYNRSYVTGEGIDPPRSVHHRPSGADSVVAPYPGLLVGGGTSSTNWADLQNSYSTNEVAINWNSALVFALAALTKGSGSTESIGPLAPQTCNIRLNSLGYSPARSKVATVTSDCEVTTVVPCPVGPQTFGGDTGGPPSPIDDLEDSNLQILAREGRQGSWSAYDDQTQGATRTNVEMRPSGRAGSEFAACISGRGYTSWGGGMGVSLSYGTTREVYDASRYTGLSFWAKGSSTPFRVMLVDRNSDPQGGVCSDSCYDHFQKAFTPNGTWQKFSFTWSEFSQLGFGSPLPSPCPSALYAVQFQWPTNSEIDLCIDDLAFLTPVDTAIEGAAGTDAVGSGGQATAAGGAPAVPAKMLFPAGGGCLCRVSRHRRPPIGPALLAGAALGGWFTRRRRRHRLPWP